MSMHELDTAFNVTTCKTLTLISLQGAGTNHAWSLHQKNIRKYTLMLVFRSQGFTRSTKSQCAAWHSIKFNCYLDIDTGYESPVSQLKQTLKKCSIMGAFLLKGWSHLSICYILQALLKAGMHTGSPGCNDWFSPRGGPALWWAPGVPVAVAATGRHNKLALIPTICSQLDLQGEAAELCVAPCCCVCPAASITYGNMRNVLKMCLWINKVVRIVSS